MSGCLLTLARNFIKWREAGYELDCLAINVSGVQLNQKNLPNIFTGITDQLGIATRHIELEITENYIIDHVNNKMNTLNTLRESGFKISVDDFGTGYSSMAYLKTLPLNKIKIDKSFIVDIPQDNNNVQITKSNFSVITQSWVYGYC